MSNLWQTCLNKIHEIIPAQNFETWFKPIKFIGIDSEKAVIEVPNKFFKDWINDNYLELIKKVIDEVSNEKVDLIISTEKESKSSAHEKGLPLFQKRENLLKKIEEASLNNRYTFDKFVVGSSNQFAHAAAVAVANIPSKTYNPLFIYGGVGLGKTHLLQAIGYQILSINQSAEIMYISAERFMYDMINSLRNNRMPEFKLKYRNKDVLLIDDIQFLGGKKQTEEEFFYTFNSLYEAKKQIVITSDRHPKEISQLEDRLRSRFSWGLIADIQPPELETKIAILKKKAEVENVSIPDEVAFFIASGIDSNIRELEGILTRLVAFSSFTGKKITVDFAKEVLKGHIREKTREINIEIIQKNVAGFFNIKVNDIKSQRKLKNISFPRQIAMYISRKLVNASFPEIGLKFGGKDHSTVIYACKKIEEELNCNTSLKSTVETIINNIKEGKS